jgi:hypothetical protein
MPLEIKRFALTQQAVGACWGRSVVHEMMIEA